MLTIDRLRLDCRTARDHPAPQEVATRLRRVAELGLPNQLSAQLNRTVAPTDTRIVLIRRLRVQLHLDAALAEDVLAKAFASAIAVGIEAAEPDQDVVVYEDETEQIARLLIDLAAGTAWKRWQHRRAFPGLAHLSPSAAIRTVALESPRRFLDATARMTMGSLQMLTAAVHPIDADRITASLPLTEQTVLVDSEDIETVRTLWDDHPAVSGDALLLSLAARRLVPQATIGQIRESIHLAEIDHVTRAPALPVGHEVTWTTPFGALFLLLPYLVEAGAIADDARHRRGIALSLAGPNVEEDPAIGALLGLNDTQSTASSDKPLDALTFDWLTRVNAVGPVQPAVRTARLASRRVTVVVDVPTGHWLSIASGVGTAAAIRRVTDRFPQSDAGRRILLAQELRRLGALQRTTLDDCLTANNLIRRVANSLPGFAAASSAHVWRQALDAPADVTVTPTGWHVQIQRSPLAEILRICGHGDRTTAVPWLDGLPVRVVIAP